MPIAQLQMNSTSVQLGYQIKPINQSIEQQIADVSIEQIYSLRR
ncbi:hypothetical protein [Bacillus sp. D386]|nr:hypothetical protein [Bacillus sp. D386]